MSLLKKIETRGTKATPDEVRQLFGFYITKLEEEDCQIAGDESLRRMLGMKFYLYHVVRAGRNKARTAQRISTLLGVSERTVRRWGQIVEGKFK